MKTKLEDFKLVHNMTSFAKNVIVEAIHARQIVQEVVSRAGEMAQRVRALTVLPGEDPGSIPS
ncbi:hypothetical protein ACQP3F_31725, partial [Escherichia coli]